MTTDRTTPIDEPPERRQTLGLMLVAALAYLPLAAHLSWQISAFLALVVGLRLAGVRWSAAAPGRFALLTLTVVGGLNCWHAYHGLPGKAGGAALFVTMLGLKLLELRARRDYRIVAVLLGFLVVVQFLFDQGAGLTVYLGAVMLGAVALLVDFNGGLGDRGWLRSIRVAGRLALEALPIALVLFVLFPRLGAPLWNLGLERGTALTGMSDRLEPGSISNLVINGDLAFRAHFDRPPPAASRLYWRGLVLWEAGETGWAPGLDPQYQPGDGRMERADGWIDYDVVLEPSGRRWMFALDLPGVRPPGSLLSADFQLLADQPLTTAKRYRMRSALDYRTADPPEQMRRYALGLPRNVTARMRDLVAGWRKDASSDWDVVESALDFFHREPFGYTLLPPRLGINPTDEFLFETRSGFCEHYASSFAVLMRIADIPSRLVLGYLGGEVNRIGGYYMVWQSDAHAWVEVLIEGRGWVRVDPTGAVAPERVDNRSASQLLGAGSSVRFQLGDNSLLGRTVLRVRELADSVQAAWQDWVLDYTVTHQRSLLALVNLDAYDDTALVVLMVVSLGLVTGLILVAMVRGGERLDPLERSYARFCRRLQRIGLPRRDWEGPRDYGQRVVVARPDLAAQVGHILAIYVRERYGSDSSTEGSNRFARAVGRFRPKAKAPISRR
jgi:protein-glutamine gamma-glutamyltransferase